MKIPNGYPMREVTEKQYYDDIDLCLGINELEVEEQQTLRLIRNRRSQDNYALDYPVVVHNIETRMRPGVYGSPEYAVVFSPVSAEGIVLPSSKRAKIMESGVLYSTLRIILSREFEPGNNGYFVGSDDIDDEWRDFQALGPTDIPIGPELVTI